MKDKPVFIHSLFRTGSTYLWNKFRQSGRYHCYYEPFHQALVQLAVDRQTIWNHDHKTTQSLHHPDLDKSHTDEYRSLLEPGRKGVPHFKKSFSFDDFCNNGDNPDQKAYIDYLMQGAGSKIPLFQFNRSALRVDWFQKHYPEAVHIYLLRNPRDQFHSYVSMWDDNKLDIFLVMDLMIAGKNTHSKYFAGLARSIPLFAYHSAETAAEIAFYSLLLPSYSNEERYSIFYTIWLAALLENALHAGLLLNINLLSTDPAYRENTAAAFNELGIQFFDFSDSRIANYNQTILSPHLMTNIEEVVQARLLKEFKPREIEQAIAGIGPGNCTFFNLDKDRLLALRERPLPVTPINQKREEKYKNCFTSFSEKLAQQQDQIRDLIKKIENRDSRLKQQSQILDDIHNSRAYRFATSLTGLYNRLKRITKTRIKENGKTG